MTRTNQLTLRRIMAALLTAIPAALLHAQDTRAVKEPAVPPTCFILKAALTPAQATSGAIEARADRAGSPSTALDTTRIQQALDHCDQGHAVELAALSLDTTQTAFLIGPIALRAGVTLLIDKGVTLYASRNPEFYAIDPASCGLVNDNSNPGCRPLISVKNASGAAIMGDGAIDGQGGATLIVDGKPSAKSWWDLAEDARTAGHPQSPHLIDASHSDNLTLYRITLRNSPSTHLALSRGDGLTVWGVTIDTPKTARNTIGIDLAESKNITITQSFLRTGEDAIAIEAGDGPTTGVSIVHNHLYWGRGLTIGGETMGGVSGIRVQDLALDGPDFGLRIRSNPAHGGLVEDVIYNDICIRNAKNPIFFDTAYTFPGKGVTPIPVYDDITLRNVRISGGGRLQFNGFDTTHRIALTLDGVFALDPPDRYKAQATHTDFTFAAGPVNFIFTGDDSTATGKQAAGTLPACSANFIPFP